MRFSISFSCAFVKFFAFLWHFLIDALRFHNTAVQRRNFQRGNSEGTYPRCPPFLTPLTAERDHSIDHCRDRRYHSFGTHCRQSVGIVPCAVQMLHTSHSPAGSLTCNVIQQFRYVALLQNVHYRQFSLCT